MTNKISRRFLLASLSALAVSACTSSYENIGQPDISARFMADSPARHAGDNPWWSAFRDKTLDNLILDGLARNLDIRKAVVAIDEADANARLTGAPDIPQADISASGSRRGSDDLISESSSGTFGISWMIDVFGANRAARRGAEARLDAAYLSADLARLTVASAIASAYIDLRYYQESVTLSEASLKSRRKSLALTRQKVELGISSRADELQALQLVAQSEAGLPDLEMGLDQALNRLATLTGQKITNIQKALSKSRGQPRARYAASVGVPADVIRIRPDIGIAERNFAAAVAGIGEAEAAFYPKLSLSGTITPSNAAGLSSTSWGFGPQISLPIFSGGANRARLDAAHAKAEQARLNWQSAILKAVEEVENALAAYNRDGRSVKANQKFVSSTSESLDLARSSYDLGESDFFPVLEHERSLRSAEQALAGAIRRQALDYVTLSVASAGAPGLPAAKGDA